MSSAYFDNQLLHTPLAENNNHTILLFDASQLQVDELTLTQFLSPFELSVIARRKTPQAKQEYVATRLLLKYLVKSVLPSSSNITLDKISSEFNQQTSKLELNINNNQVYSCCVSHSHGLVGVALNINNSLFGFDIEKISLKRPFEKLAKHFYDAAEVALITKQPCTASKAATFFRLWTLKEALAKATSRPIAQLLSPNVFCELGNSQLSATSTALTNDVNEQFDISVVAKKSTDWRCSFISLKALSSKLAFK